MSKRTKKPSAAPWVVAVAAGGMLVSGFGGGANAAPIESSSTSPGAVVAQAAKDAGFTGNDLAIAIAVAKAESGYRSTASLRNGPTKGCPNGSTDRGVWEINNCYHPKVSNACAYDVKCNAKAAFKISNGGRNWNPWASYSHGKHRPFMSEARSLAAGVQ